MPPPLWPSPALKARRARPAAASAPQLRPHRRQRPLRHRRLHQRPRKSRVSSPGSKACSASERRLQHLHLRPPLPRRLRPKPRHVASPDAMGVMARAADAAADAMAAATVSHAMRLRPVKAAVVKDVVAAANAPVKAVPRVMQTPAHRATRNAAPMAKPAMRVNRAKHASHGTAARAAVAAATPSRVTRPQR